MSKLAAPPHHLPGEEEEEAGEDEVTEAEGAKVTLS